MGDAPLTMSKECVFCKIVQGNLAASRVAETDDVLAFMSTNPITPGHMLVIPKAHLAELADLSDKIASEMFVIARSLAQALRQSRIRSDGVNLFYADGEAASQEVFHAHLHVFPRFKGDGFTMDAQRGSQPTREELNQLAAAIRNAR